MKYALIGCGRIAVNHIAAALQAGLELTAVCDVQPKKMEQLLAHFSLDTEPGIRRYTDYRQLLRQHTDLQLCAIAAESGRHAAIALDCIDAGVNLIVEKPLAMSIVDAQEIVRRSGERGVLVCACHQNRFNAAVQQTKRALDSGRIGRLSHASLQVRWYRDRAYYEQAAWRGTWGQDGGCLMNQCIHGLDLLRWLVGAEPKTVYGRIRRQQHPYIQAEDLGMALIEFDNGVLATAEGTTNVYPEDLEETICLFGENGTIKIGGTCANRIDVWRLSDEADTDGLLDEYTQNIYGNGHVRLYADVVQALRMGRAPYVDAQAGERALELVLAIYESQRTGLPVTLPLERAASAQMRGWFSKTTT